MYVYERKDVIIIKQELESLINDNYKVLSLLYDNQITINGETYCNLTQVEMSDMLNVTRMTLSKRLKELKNNNLIVFEKQKYVLTNRAIQIIETIEKT